MLKKWTVIVSVIFSIFVLVQAGRAQTTTAALSGLVTDETGGVLPGAQVTVTNTATGIRRSVTTDAGGRFVASQLPPCSYEVTVTISGFETMVRQGITLAVGQEANLTLAMKVGTVTEQVTVIGEAPLVNTSTSSVGGVVDEKQITQMPLNGRDFSQLPLVQPGVTAFRNGEQTVSKGYGTRISMGGSRPDQTAWLLDGTNIHGISNFGTPGSAAGLMLGVDAVREFQVLTSNYGAELGGTSGGVVNMVSKSGTNSFHGTLFEFLRNSALDARNFFDRTKPPFKRNQFGGSLGGPILKDKTFFFGSYEGLRQRLGVTQVANVPDASVHQLTTVAPSTRPYLDIWPLPNGGSLGGGMGIFFGPASSPANEDYFIVRVDHHLSDKHSLFARFTFDQGNFARPDAVPVTSTTADTHTRYTTVQHDYIVSPQFLMTTRIAYNRTRLHGDEIPLISYPSSLNLLYPGMLPELRVPGATNFGPAGNNLVNRAQNLYDFQEHLQYLHGSHSMRFGFQFDHLGSAKGIEIAAIAGTFTWNSLQDFLADNRLSAFAALATGSDTYRSLVSYIYGAYLQDDWKLRPNFTLNLGLRYEPFTVPTEKHGRLSTMKDWVHATAFDVGPLFDNPSKKNFSPRVGFSWAPRGDGKTAVRAGFGLFFVTLQGAHYILPAQKNPPFLGTTATVLGNLASAVSDMARISPALLSATTSPASFPEIIQWDLNSSYEIKFNVAVERQLPGNLSLTAGYLGGRGIHLWEETDVNDPPPILRDGRPFVAAGTPRLNPNLGVGTSRYSDAQSFYNALQLEVKKRFSHGFQFQTSYTWSKNIDDSTTGVAGSDFTLGGVGYTSQPYNPKADRGLSSLHIGQTFVLNGIYEIPSPVPSGLFSALLGGWQVATILTANSGAPLSAYVSGRNAPDMSRNAGVQRPDLVAGRSVKSIVTGNPNQYFDPTAFYLPPAGFYGNAGRNILIGPGLLNFDFSLQKSTPLPIREGSRLEFHADFFNLLNRANFANPRVDLSQVLNPATRAYIAGAGKITGTVTPSRQLQFGLKLIF